MSTDERRDIVAHEGGSEKPGYFFFADTNEVVPWYEMARLASVGAGREVMAQVGFSFAARLRTGTEKDRRHPMSTDERRDAIRKILARGYGEAREDVVTVLASLLREQEPREPAETFRRFGRNVITDGFCKWGVPEPPVSEAEVYAIVDRHIANNADIYAPLAHPMSTDERRDIVELGWQWLDGKGGSAYDLVPKLLREIERLRTALAATDGGMRLV